MQRFVFLKGRKNVNKKVTVNPGMNFQKLINIISKKFKLNIDKGRAYNMTNITMVLACDKNGCIGKEGKLPWRIRSEMEHFLKTVAFKPLVMGKSTCISLKKPINTAPNYVLTSDKEFHREGFITVHSIEELLNIVKETNLYVVGGAQLYKQFFDMTEKDDSSIRIIIEVSIIDIIVEDGDAFFDLKGLNEHPKFTRKLIKKNVSVGEPAWQAYAYYKAR